MKRKKPIKSIITIYKLPFNLEYSNDRENWYRSRVEGLTYFSKLKGEKAAEEAFHITNAPLEILNKDQQTLLEMMDFKGPSLSVGDIVRIDPYVKKPSTGAEYYLCKSIGWERYKNDTIELIKYLSW